MHVDTAYEKTANTKALNGTKSGLRCPLQIAREYTRQEPSDIMLSLRVRSSKNTLPKRHAGRWTRVQRSTVQHPSIPRRTNTSYMSVFESTAGGNTNPSRRTEQSCGDTLNLVRKYIFSKQTNIRPQSKHSRYKKPSTDQTTMYRWNRSC